MANTTNEIKFLKGAYSDSVQSLSTNNADAIMFTTGTPRMYVGGDVWYGNLSLVLASNKIQLKNGSGATAPVIGEVDTTSFVKDGMLNSAELVNEMPDTSEGAAEGAKVQGTFIKLVWNTDAAKQPMYVDVASLVPNLTNYLTGVTVDGVTAEVADNVATISTNNISGITVNGSAVTVTDKVAAITIEDEGITGLSVNGVDAAAATDNDKKLEVIVKGDDIEVADSYAAPEFSTAFTAASENVIAANDKINAAIQKLDNKEKAIVDEMIKNEQVVAITAQALATAAGTKDVNGIITYTANTEATYISGATSLADADDKLDAAIKELSQKEGIGVQNFETSAVQLVENGEGSKKYGAKIFWGEFPTA